MRSHPALRLLLGSALALAVVVASGTAASPLSGLAAGLHGCADQGIADTAEHDGHGVAPAGDALAGVTLSQPTCPCDHCPAGICAMAAGCNGSTSSVVVSPQTVPQSALGAPAVGAPWRPTHSRTSRPPTPPPTALL